MPTGRKDHKTFYFLHPPAVSTQKSHFKPFLRKTAKCSERCSSAYIINKALNEFSHHQKKTFSILKSFNGIKFSRRRVFREKKNLFLVWRSELRERPPRAQGRLANRCFSRDVPPISTLLLCRTRKCFSAFSEVSFSRFCFGGKFKNHKTKYK